MALLLAACGTGGEPNASGQASSPATGSPAATATAPASAAPRATSSTIQAARPTPSATAGVTATPQPVASFDVDTVGEASGLARSGRDDDLFWMVDDGPGAQTLTAVHLDGRAVVTVRVAGLDSVDSEALAAGPCASDDDRPCLFVGDIGDNASGRADVRVHRLVEPDLVRGIPDDPVEAEVAVLTYPDGPTDAEAMFALDGRLFIVTKAPFDAESSTTGPTRLYEVPEFADGEVVSRGVVPVPPPRLALVSTVVGNVVTGADALPGRVVLRTYDHAVVYSAADGTDADPAQMGRWPFSEVPTSGPLQTEGIALGADGCTTLTVGEGSGVLWRTPCP